MLKFLERHGIEARGGVFYTQAGNCVFCLHIGETAIHFGSGLRPNGRGARLEVWTPGRWLRWTPGEVGVDPWRPL